MIAWLRTIDDDPRTERVIMFLIIINAVILGLETNKAAMASYGRLLQILDHVILAVFVIEILARMLVHRAAFFRDPWSVFDFVVDSGEKSPDEIVATIAVRTAGSVTTISTWAIKPSTLSSASPMSESLNLLRHARVRAPAFP